MDDSDGPDVVQTGTQVSITSSESDMSSYNVNSLEALANTLEPTSEFTSSIEIITPQEVQQEPVSQPESREATQATAQVPVGLALQLPTLAIPPVNPQTNVTTVYNDELFTEDEDEDKTVPSSLNNPGRTQTLSPTPNLVNTVRSAIELTASDFQPQDQPLLNKCAEVDLLLSTNVTGPQHNRQVREELVTLIPILYQTAFNTEGFPILEKYLWETVGTLPHLSLLTLSLDAIFDEFLEISAIQTKVYHMLKCYLSVTNQPAVHQFQDIHLTNPNFDRVAGTNFDRVSGAEQSLHTDLNDTYYSIYSQAQRRVTRIVQESVEFYFTDSPESNRPCPQCFNRTNSCTDLRE